MSNEEIILENSIALMEAGILAASGDTITITTTDGEEVEMQEPEEIHTFAEWKRNGYAVKKGEKAVASFQIWKYKKCKKKVEENGKEVEKEYERMFLTPAFFFKRSQVERIKLIKK